MLRSATGDPQPKEESPISEWRWAHGVPQTRLSCQRTNDPAETSKKGGCDSLLEIQNRFARCPWHPPKHVQVPQQDTRGTVIIRDRQSMQTMTDRRKPLRQTRGCPVYPNVSSGFGRTIRILMRARRTLSLAASRGYRARRWRSRCQAKDTLNSLFQQKVPCLVVQSRVFEALYDERRRVRGAQASCHEGTRPRISEEFQILQSSPDSGGSTKRYDAFIPPWSMKDEHQ